MNDTEFGILKYSNYNIGDEIQSLAAGRFIPHINYYINRERTDLFKKTSIIAPSKSGGVK